MQCFCWGLWTCYILGGWYYIELFFGTILNAAQGIAIQLSGQLSVLSNNMLRSINPVVNHLAGEGNLKK